MNVGDYCRTRRGTLDRFITSHTQDNLTWYTFEDRGNITNPENYVIKSSPNIIDLIEEHDILKIEEQKGIYTICEVEEFRDPYVNYKFLGVRLENQSRARKLYELNIKSIVTREQFESMKYEVSNNER